VHYLGPRNVLVDARNRGGPLHWIRKPQTLDRVPHAHRDIVRTAAVRAVAEIPRHPPHLVSIAAVARNERRRETLDAAYVLGVVVAEGENPQIV
jgi:hypothetical protein